jgi:hypothetical protein
MNTIQKNLAQTGDVAIKARLGDVEILAVGSRRPMFTKKIFCARQSFKRNIKSWEGPGKSYLPLGVPPLTDWWLTV